MNKAATPYLHLHARKRTWTPVAVTPGTLLKGGEETCKRALSLRQLEIPVGSFIEEASKGDLPSGSDAEGCLDLLASNIADEEKHDLALNYAADAHKVSARMDAEGAHITKQWLELDRHPVLKALIIERSVFFVLLPIFRSLGDSGLRTTSQDISRDEVTHMACNALVCKDLGLASDKTLNNLRRATVAWVTQGLDATNENKYLSRNFWMAQSDSLYATGKAEGLIETRASRMPAFFEIDNQNLPQYA